MTQLEPARALDVAVEFASNPEPRCACVLLLDVSGSMHGSKVAALNEGLRAFAADIGTDALARQRRRAPLRLARPPSRTSQAATPCRSAATASRRVAVKSSAGGSPQISPITAPIAAHLKPSSIAHSAALESRASTWMRSEKADPGG